MRRIFVPDVDAGVMLPRNFRRLVRSEECSWDISLFVFCRHDPLLVVTRNTPPLGRPYTRHFPRRLLIEPMSPNIGFANA